MKFLSLQRPSQKTSAPDDMNRRRSIFARFRSHVDNNAKSVDHLNTASDDADALDIIGAPPADIQSIPSLDDSDFNIRGVNATSLFGVFEVKLAEQRKNEQDSVDAVKLRRSRSTMLPRVGSRKASNASSTLSRTKSDAITSRLGRQWTLSERLADRRKSKLVQDTTDHNESLSLGLDESPIASVAPDMVLSQSAPTEKDIMESRVAGNLERAASVRKIRQIASTDSGIATLAVKPSTESLMADIADMTPIQRRKNAAAIRRKLRTSTVKSEQPLVEEINADMDRIIVASEEPILIMLLINPNIDETYRNFTVDFFLTYRYYLSETDFWNGLESQYQTWSQKAKDIREKDHEDIPVASSEDRVGRHWILPDSDSEVVLMR